MSDRKENERQRQERADLVNAFTRTAWQSSSQPRVGPRVLAGGAALVLVAGATFGLGAMVSNRHKQAASERARQLALAAQNRRTTPSLQVPASPTASPTPTPSPTRRPVRSVRPAKSPRSVSSARGGRDAYRALQAESFARRSKHLSTENSNDTGGGRNIASAANGDWAYYTRIDFGSTAATRFYARVASDKDQGYGRVEVRLDRPGSTPIATLYNINTGGWQNWSTVSVGANGLTGVHNVYLTFKSDQLWDFININWFRFGH